MKGLFRSAGAFFAAVILGASLLVAVVVGAVSGGSAADASSQSAACVPGLTSAGLATGAVPAQYVAALNAASKISGLPAPVLAGQLKQESGFNPKAVSAAGARGIAQFMPGTWASYGKGADPFDPLAGIDAQGRYMAELFKQAKTSGLAGDPVDLALAGYNAGWGGVTAARGVPDNGETAQYVVRIRQYANDFADKGGTAVKASAPDPAGCDIATGQGTGVDDYPFKDLPHCELTAAGGYAGCPAGSQSQFGAFNRECVDFVMWRLNQDFGSTQAPWKITNGSFRPDGKVLGDARDYFSAWVAKGWPTDRTPTVGAVAWYGPSNPVAPAGYGHVAIVKAVYPDGSYLEEGYNFGFPPDDHRYYTMKRANTLPDMFLHLPTK